MALVIAVPLEPRSRKADKSINNSPKRSRDPNQLAMSIFDNAERPEAGPRSYARRNKGTRLLVNVALAARRQGESREVVTRESAEPL
jgi:hypothetical protein